MHLAKKCFLRHLFVSILWVDPVLYKSRPIGFDTQRIMEEYGYSLEDIKKMSGTSVLCYEGEPLPDSVFEPSYGPHSIRN